MSTRFAIRDEVEVAAHRRFRRSKEFTHVNEDIQDDMRPEYGFATMTGGVRGKYYCAYQEGHVVRIHKADGATETYYFTLEDGAAMLEPEIQRYFPTSAAVNDALRDLIRLAKEVNCAA